MGKEHPPRVEIELGRALQCHREGKLAEAERLYGEILSNAPGHPGALHFLGVLRHQLGDNRAAMESFGDALRSDPDNPFVRSNAGVVLIALKRFDEALSHLDHALALKPDYAAAHSNRGMALAELDRIEEALASYDRALALDPNYVDALYNRGNALNALTRYAKAIADFDRALALAPRWAPAHYNRGNSLMALARFEEAVASYDRTLAFDPAHADALCNRGHALRHLGRLTESSASFMEALRIAPGYVGTWIGFSEHVRYAIDLDEKWEPYLLAGLKNGDLDPQRFERAATGLVYRASPVQALLREANDPSSGHETFASALEARIDRGALDEFLKMPLLLAILEECLVTRFEAEKVLVALRHALLLLASRAEASGNPTIERFASALALQCFANEYVYAETESERRSLAGLLDRLSSAFRAGGRFPPLWVKVVACYRPLSNLDFASELLHRVVEFDDDGLRTVVQRQIVEPRQEHELKNALPALTSIAGGVSDVVRRQYEENPYPRWRRRNQPEAQEPLHATLRTLFPAKGLPATSPTPLDVLVAGCGTGSHPIQVFRRFANARILAVDLSLASLAYAKRMTEERGVAIEYGCADILNLGSLGRQFDLIDSTGVLHHLRDPLEGWRVLADLLRPQGYMKIGLYSRRARRDLTALRQWIVERGFAPTAEGIRACREAIISKPERRMLGRFEGIDFASTSACRDLLFHVQEHLFSPLSIGDCLDRLALEFLGFEFRSPRTLIAYKARFPNDPACDSLANWERFEEEHPNTFIGMYQFWVRKRNGH